MRFAEALMEYEEPTIKGHAKTGAMIGAGANLAVNAAKMIAHKKLIHPGKFVTNAAIDTAFGAGIGAGVGAIRRSGLSKKKKKKRG